MVDAITFATRSLSYKCSCFVLNACATISDEMRERLPYTDQDRVFLDNAENGGGSSIIGADSVILAGPMSGAEEGLLVADVDLEDCVRAKLVHDYSGHYNRPDVFTLTVNTSVPAYLEMIGDLALHGREVEQEGPGGSLAEDANAGPARSRAEPAAGNDSTEERQWA